MNCFSATFNLYTKTHNINIYIIFYIFYNSSAESNKDIILEYTDIIEIHRTKNKFEFPILSHKRYNMYFYSDS